jgi:hypothetical protein
MTFTEKVLLIGAIVMAGVFMYMKAYFLFALMLVGASGTLFRAWRRRHHVRSM